MPILRYFSMFIYTCNASFKANNNTIRRCNTSCFNKSFSSLSIRYGRYAVFGAHSTCESIVRTSSVRYTTRVSRTDVLSSGSYSVFPSYDFLTHSCSTSLFIFINMSPSYCLNDELRTFSAVLTYFHTYRFFCSPILSTSTRVMTINFGYKALHGNTTLRSSMAQPSNTAYGVGNNNLADTHGNNSVSTAELINRGAVSSTINNGDMVSFYESCILEINKIAVEGKRVFRNHASSKKSSTVNRGSFTYLDDLDLPFSTNLCIRRFTYLNRRYARIRAHARKHRLYRVRVLRRTTYRRVRVALKGKVTRFLKKKHIDKKKHHIKKNAKKVHNTETKDKSKKKHYANKTNYHPPKAAYEEKNNYQHNYQHNYQYNWMIRNVDEKISRRKYSKESKRRFGLAFRFLHSVELRANLKIHITTRIPYTKWRTKYGLVDSVRTYSAWESYISLKINSTLFREVRKLVKRASKRGFIPTSFVSVFKYFIRRRYRTNRRTNIRTKLPICYRKVKDPTLRSRVQLARTFLVDVIHTFSDEIFTKSLSTLFMYHYDSLLSFPCNSTRYVSLSDLKGILLSIFLQLPTISAINLYVANASLLSFEYQLFDRIYMLVRTVFDISQHNFNGYVNLCSFIRKVAAHTFVFFHRSYVSDVCRRAILSVPSERSAEVLAMLPKKHREIFVSLSPSKAKRYRDMLIRTGVLHIPDFYDKKFTFFCNSKLNARDPKILHVNTIRFKHLVHNNNSHVLYTFFLYYSIFLYSSGTSFLHIISRSRLFNTSSFLCRNNMAFNSTRSNMFDSFTRSIVHFDCPSDRIKKKADPYAIVNKRYIVVKPFFHGDAIVFFFSPISKKTQVVYTFARLISTSITVSPVLFRLRSWNTVISTWNALSNRYLYSNAQTRRLRRIDNSFCNRLVSQSGTTNALISSYLYTGRFLKAYVKLYKKSRKYFSLCRRRYQTKWFN